MNLLHLAHLFGAYFHSDWVDEFPSWRHAVARYTTDHAAEEVSRAGLELASLLEEIPDDAALARIVFGRLGCSYDPRPEQSLRAWLGDVTAALSPSGRAASAAQGDWQSVWYGGGYVPGAAYKLNDAVIVASGADADEPGVVIYLKLSTRSLSTSSNWTQVQATDLCPSRACGQNDAPTLCARGYLHDPSGHGRAFVSERRSMQCTGASWL